MDKTLGETVGGYNVGSERTLSKAEGGLNVVAVPQRDGSRGAVCCTPRSHTKTCRLLPKETPFTLLGCCRV